MADFNTKVRFTDSGISTSTSTTSPTLKKRGTELYIVAPTGFLRATDKIKLERNISSRWKSRSNGTKGTIPNTGWLRPMMNGTAMVPLQLEYLKYRSNAYMEYWRVSVNLQLTDNTGAEIPQTDVARMLYYYETQGLHREEAVNEYNSKYVKVTCSGSVPLYLSGKQLGICVERNGVQITDYMTFTVDLGYTQNNPPRVSHVALARYSPRWTQSVRKRTSYRQDYGEPVGL